MGHSGAYGGSGGRAWGSARAQADEYLDDPSEENAAELIRRVVDALDWDDKDGADWRPSGQPVLGLRRRSGSGDGPGGGGGAGGGRQPSATGGSGRGRSRARAAYVAGQVASAGIAARSGDATTLRELGLTIGDLDGLAPFEQAQRILEALGASLGGLEEEELNAASSAALLGLLEDPTAAGADAIRVFVIEYVFEVAMTEIGDEFRDGRRDGFTTPEEEDTLRDLIEARVGQMDFPDVLTASDAEAAVYVALDDVRTFLGGRA